MIDQVLGCGAWHRVGLGVFDTSHPVAVFDQLIKLINSKGTSLSRPLTIWHNTGT